MILIFIVLFFVLYLFFISLFTEGNHLKYAIEVSKNYDFKSFFSAFFWSYFVDQKFVTFSMILKKKGDFETVSIIDMVCHQVLEGYENARVLKYDNNKINFKGSKVNVDIVVDNLGIMDLGWNHNIVLHPRTIRLIQKALEKSLTQ